MLRRLSVGLVTAALIGIIAIEPALAQPAESTSAGATPAAATRTVTATDGRSSLVAPADWQSKTGINDSAEIQLAGPGERWLIVLTEDKDDFVNMNLKKYCEGRKNSIIRGVTDPKISDPKDTVYHNYKAVQYEIEGAHGDVQIKRLLTCLEGQKNWFQVYAWSVRSRFPLARAQFESILQSFTEHPDVAPQ